MRLFLSSLRFRLLLLVLLAIVPALGLILYTASEQRQLAAAQAQQNALQLARTAAGTQEDLVETTHQLLNVLVQLPAVRDADEAVCSAYLSALLKDYPQYVSLGVKRPNGEFYCVAPQAADSARAKQVRLLSAMDSRVSETRDFAVGDVEIGFISGKAILVFGKPLLDETNRVQSIVYAAMDVAILNQPAVRATLPPGSTFMVIDRNGTIVAHYPDPESWVGQSARNAPIVQAILSHPGEGTVEALGEDNVPRLYAYVPLRRVPAETVYVSVGIPYSVAFAGVNAILGRNVLALGLVAILALAAAWIGGDWFVLRQMNVLVGVTARIADGDLSARTGSVHGATELKQLSGAFDRMAQTLEQREVERREQAQVRASLLHKTISAQEDERKRIARELHDEMTQSLTLLIMNLDLGRAASPGAPGIAEKYHGNARTMADEMLTNLDRLIGDLRPPILDELGLVSAIASYGEQRLKPHGIAFVLRDHGLDPCLPADMATALFRIVQEALTNTVKHAGATTVIVTLLSQDDKLVLIVEDNGTGFEIPAVDRLKRDGKGFGLLGMQERAGILGAEFDLASAPGKGTRITMRLPGL